MKIQRKFALFFCGAVWFTVGIFLITLGIKFLFTGERPFFVALGTKSGVVLAAMGAVLLGVLKGKKVLKKSAYRTIQRLHQPQIPVAKIYRWSDVLIIALMIGLGLAMKLFQVSTDIRGVIDLAVGSGLVIASLYYFRQSHLW